MKYLLLGFSVLVVGCSSQKQTQDGAGTATYETAKKWFDKKDWLQGAKWEPNIPLDVQEFSRQYHLNPGYWTKVFNYLKTTDLHAIKPGKYPIDGDNVYASVTQDATKDYDKTNWESHRKYIDVQCVIEGEEKIGVMNVDGAEVTKPYDDQKDVANYKGEAPLYTGKAGTFFIFFPSNAHRPNITPGGNKVEKKVVIKVRAS